MPTYIGLWLAWRVLCYKSRMDGWDMMGHTTDSYYCGAEVMTLEHRSSEIIMYRSVAMRKKLCICIILYLYYKFIETREI